MEPPRWVMQITYSGPYAPVRDLFEQARDAGVPAALDVQTHGLDQGGRVTIGWPDGAHPKEDLWEVLDQIGKLHRVAINGGLV